MVSDYSLEERQACSGGTTARKPWPTADLCQRQYRLWVVQKALKHAVPNVCAYIYSSRQAE